MAVWIFLLALATYAGGVGTGWPLLQHVSYALAFVLAASFAFVLAARRGVSAQLSVDRHVLTAGEETGETITVRKRGPFPALWLVLASPETGRQSFLGLRGGEELFWRRKRVFLYRGRYAIGGDRVGARDAFGLFSLPACTLHTVEVTVYPREIAVPMTRELESVVGRRTRPWQEAADASIGDLRQYVAGDPPSRIHWRSTARTGTLIVADPEPRSRRTVWIVVDLGGEEEQAERSAGVARYLCSLLFASGSRVGAIVAGDEIVVIPPRASTESAILDALARVPASQESRLRQAARALSRAETPDGAIVVSPFDAADIGRMRRSARALVTVPTADSGGPA
jgi:uncharacterized protein (DUF58 family)